MEETRLDAGAFPAEELTAEQELSICFGAPDPVKRAAAGRLRAVASPSAPPRPEELLAEAVVLQAAADWRLARELLELRPGDSRAAALKKETERFFRSRWFSLLTDLDGEALLCRLKEGLREPPAADPLSRRRDAVLRGIARRRRGRSSGERG